MSASEGFKFDHSARARGPSLTDKEISDMCKEEVPPLSSVEISEHIEAFLAQGGTIQPIPKGVGRGDVSPFLEPVNTDKLGDRGNEASAVSNQPVATRGWSNNNCF